MFEHLLHDEVRLFVIVTAVDQAGRFPADLGRPQVFLVSFVCFVDNLIRRLQDGLRAAVIFFQRDDRGPLVFLGEVQDVPYGRRPKGIDRLCIVADDGQSCTVRTDILQNTRLQNVRVLVFVYQYCFELASQQFAPRGISGQNKSRSS